MDLDSFSEAYSACSSVIYSAWAFGDFIMEDDLDGRPASRYLSSNSPPWFTRHYSIRGQLAGSTTLKSALRVALLDESS
jgi:hypothetical protein